MVIVKMVVGDQSVLVKKIDTDTLYFSKRPHVHDPEFDKSVEKFIDDDEEASSVIALLLFDDGSLCIKSNVIEYQVYVDGVLMIRD